MVLGIHVKQLGQYKLNLLQNNPLKYNDGKAFKIYMKINKQEKYKHYLQSEII